MFDGQLNEEVIERKRNLARMHFKMGLDRNGIWETFNKFKKL